MLALTRGMLALAIAAGVAPAPARDLGQWETTDPEIRAWFQGLKQPDNPASCCGEADAYWADSYESSSDGNYVAIITDSRADAPLKRHHLPIGTRIVVPQFKMKVDAGNPTGHGIVFLNQIVVPYFSDGRDHRLDVVGNTIDGMALVFCYVVPGGI